jgi:hypothetical protein
MTDTNDKLAEALSAAQGVFINPPKDRENPYFKSRYATLDSMQTATRAALAANGLSVTQGGEKAGDGWTLKTTLHHSSGASISSWFPLLAFPKGPQAAGSEITYMRRYAYAAILNITADEDDDANSAAIALATAGGAQEAPKTQSAPAGRYYDLKPTPVTQAPPEPTQYEKGTAIGVVGRIDPNQTGDCWFLSIGSLGTAKGESIWCRDKSLIDSLHVGQQIHASLRSKTPGKYQLISFVPAEEPEP